MELQALEQGPGSASSRAFLPARGHLQWRSRFGIFQAWRLGTLRWPLHRCLEVEPPVPARVPRPNSKRELRLCKKLRIACEPPEAARVQSELDHEQELDLLQRQFDLDQDSYYSNADYADDREGAAWLDYESSSK